MLQPYDVSMEPLADRHENTELLRNRFLARLLALQPESVLDIGCGAGPILAALGQAGVRALGIEPSEKRLAELEAAGLDAELGRGETVDFPDNSFDWVIYRHVLHHVAEPGLALQNAVRIAKSGLLLAEPFYDPSIPSHERAMRVNRWVLSQDRRLGHVHNPPLSAGDMRALLPDDLEDELSSESFLRLQDRPVERFIRESAEALQSLAVDDPQRLEYESLLAEVREKGHAWNGTLIVQIRIPGD